MRNAMATLALRKLLYYRYVNAENVYRSNKPYFLCGKFACFKQSGNTFCSMVVNNNCVANLRLVEDVVKQICDQIPPNEPLHLDNVQKVVSLLLQEGAKPEDLVYGFCNQPHAANKDPSCWKSSLENLRGFGAAIDQILRIVCYNPLVLDYNANRLQSLIDAMQATGISSDDLVDSLTDNPEMLNFNANEIKRRHEKLNSMFTKKDIAKLVYKNIRVLAVTTRELEQKLQYIVHRMGIEQPQVVNSEALTKPLQHIMERHQFLLRTGHYRMPNPKARTLSTSPHLKLITDTSDLDFATKIARVTLEEYQLFSRFAKERKNVLNKLLRSEDAEDDDLDDDSDDLDE